MNRRGNPFNAETEGDSYRIWDAGYNEATKFMEKHNDEWRTEFKVDEADKFVNSLYALAQEYGGDRFQYDGDDQDTLENITAALQTGVKALSGRVDTIRTLR